MTTESTYGWHRLASLMCRSTGKVKPWQYLIDVVGEAVYYAELDEEGNEPLQLINALHKALIDELD